MNLYGRGPLAALPFLLLLLTPLAQVTAATTSTVTTYQGSSQKLCQLTGQTDYEFNTTTTSQTATRYGLERADNGYSFLYDGRLWFLFGDTGPTPSFNGYPNMFNDTPRIGGDYNDAIGYVPDIAGVPNLNDCLALDFTTDSIGAYLDPVVLNSQGQPAISLAVDEAPDSGISDGGLMYVIFKTDNYVYPEPGPSEGNLGFSTRSVVAVSSDNATTWHFLYNFSVPSQPGVWDAKFVNNYIAQGMDGYLYIWGTEGGTNYRHSAVYLARKPIGSMGNATAIQYFDGMAANGTPTFGSVQSGAAPLFTDSPSNCAGEVGVEWNQFIDRWIMLYECDLSTPSNPAGIWMRTATQPWGPWSSPQTVFAKKDAFCVFIHRAVNATDPTPCDNLSSAGPDGENRVNESGGTYAPYPIATFNTGNAAQGTTTFYWNMATFNPYTQVIMKTTLQAVQATVTTTTPEFPLSLLAPGFLLVLALVAVSVDVLSRKHGTPLRT